MVDVAEASGTISFDGISKPWIPDERAGGIDQRDDRPVDHVPVAPAKRDHRLDVDKGGFAIGRSEIKGCLDRDADQASSQPSSCPKLQQLLRYIVTEALEGRPEKLKAYTIAVDGMGRREDFCAMTDPYVRNLGVRLRRAVSDFHLGATGGDGLRILLPKGSSPR